MLAPILIPPNPGLTPSPVIFPSPQPLCSHICLCHVSCSSVSPAWSPGLESSFQPSGIPHPGVGIDPRVPSRPEMTPRIGGSLAGVTELQNLSPPHAIQNVAFEESAMYTRHSGSGRARHISHPLDSGGTPGVRLLGGCKYQKGQYAARAGITSQLRQACLCSSAGRSFPPLGGCSGSS